MNIRLAALSDAERIGEIACQSSYTKFFKREFVQRFDEYKLSTWCAIEDDKVIAFVSILNDVWVRKPERYCSQISCLAIDEAKRGGMIAKQLVLLAVDGCKHKEIYARVAAGNTVMSEILYKLGWIKSPNLKFTHKFTNP